MLLTDLKHIVSDDLNKVDKLIVDNLNSHIPLIPEIGKHLIQGGGKRLRPITVLISAKACGYAGMHHIAMATVIEFIHTATLLHDDVVDNSMLRRGIVTANNKWGNEAAVLVGDFLYSRAFQLMVKVSNMQILEIIANATNAIAEGEVLQLLNQNNPETTEQSYLNVIRNKTAKLFEAAAAVAAILANTPPHIQSALSQYGMHLGTAYQLIDDLLDYGANAKTFGKQLGNDLAEGKPTLPIIYLLQHGTNEQRALAQETIIKPEINNLPAINAALRDCGAIEYTYAFAKREVALAKQAISELADSEHKEMALNLADFVLTRNH